MFQQFLSLDLPPILSAMFSSIACAVLGNYLVLRRLSLMGDAISHSVLPGIVVAFLLTSSRSSITVFIGAALAGILSALLIELVRRFGRVETGASMGVIFSIFFALGVILIEQAAARSIDLDADCLLHGQLEAIFWYPPSSTEFFSFHTLSLVPSEVYSSFFTMLLVLLFVRLLYKELKISSFDPALSTSLGFSSTLLYQLLMILVAASVVASFRVVGSILVIAMILCPAATARLYTDRLQSQIYLSVFFAALSSVFGYLAGAFGPSLVGYPHSLNASGMIAVVCGLFLGSSALFAPQYGIVGRLLRKRALGLSVRREDILALVFRAVEQGRTVPREEAFQTFENSNLTKRACARLIQEELLSDSDPLMLTTRGEVLGRETVRKHRLWESYLVSEAGMSPDHVHPTAEKLEHFAGERLEESVGGEDSPQQDPHGKKIPQA